MNENKTLESLKQSLSSNYTKQKSLDEEAKEIFAEINMHNPFVIGETYEGTVLGEKCNKTKKVQFKCESISVSHSSAQGYSSTSKIYDKNTFYFIAKGYNIIKGGSKGSKICGASTPSEF